MEQNLQVFLKALSFDTTLTAQEARTLLLLLTSKSPYTQAMCKDLLSMSPSSASVTFKNLKSKNYISLVKTEGRNKFYKANTSLDLFPTKDNGTRVEKAKEQIRYDYLVELHPNDASTIGNITDIMDEIYNSTATSISISGDAIPMSAFIKRLEKINCEDIEILISSLKSLISPIRNFKKYILKSLWDAPVTKGLSINQIDLYD